MKKLLLASTIILGLLNPAAAQKSKSALSTEVNTNLASSSNITAAILRTTLLDIVNSYYDLGGNSTLACAVNNWVTGFPTLGTISCAQPTFNNLLGTLSAAQFPALTGDITTVQGTLATTLATVNANVGTFGSATSCVSVTNNGKGLTTAISAVTCTPAISSVTGLGTGVLAALGTNVGTAGAPVLFNGAGGTPTSLGLVNAIGLPLGTGVTGTLLAAQAPAFAGDATSTAGSLTLTLATVNANVGSFGSATQCTSFTTNAKGLITAASAVTCTPALASITGLGAGVATALAIAANGAGGFPTYTAGSWTPTVTTSGVIGTPTYSVQIGTYEQIGRQVVVRFTVTLTGWTGSPTGNVSLAGLPVASTNVANDYGGCAVGFYTVAGLAASSVLTAIVPPNGTTISIEQSTTTGTSVVTQAQVGPTPTFIGMCTYHT